MINPKAGKLLKGVINRLNAGLYSMPLTRGIKVPSTAGAIFNTAAIGASIIASKVGGPIVAGIGGGFAIYKGTTALMNPALRVKMGQAIVGISKTIKTIKDPVQKSLLRTDRAVMLQALSDYSAAEKEEKEGNK
jgi:hypothetical protein